MNRKYELTIILPEETSNKAATGFVESYLSKTGGKISDSSFWGKKDLAYQIKKVSRAFYGHFILEMEPSEAVELDKRLRFDEKLLRYLLVLQNTKQPKIKKQIKEEKAK